ncbi:MAG: AraC family transcriptional regulator [Balneolaceae bacterium]
MNPLSIPPSDILKPFIKSFLIIESDNGTINRILPDTSLVVAFRLRGKVTFQDKKNETVNDLPLSLISGLRDSSRLIRYSKKSATFLVIFKEGGASLFFNNPLHELFGLQVSLDNLADRRILHETEERLSETKNNRERVAVVERFLVSQLYEQRADSLIFHSIRKIRSVKGDIKINNLLTELPISRDPFEKRFRRITGTSPKRFSGIIRFRSLIDSYSKEKDLTEIAYSAGYFDQPHFIKDFRLYTGQSPKDFFRSPSFW